MSNAKKPSAKPYSLEQHRKAAEKKAKDAGGAYVLNVSEEERIEVPRPSGDTMLSVEEAATSRQVIHLLCGEQADRLMELIGSEDNTLLESILDEMRKHFGLAVSQG